MNGYRLLLVSAVGERDGMSLELVRDSGERVAEIFEEEASGERSLTVFSTAPIPIGVAEWFIAEAARRL